MPVFLEQGTPRYIGSSTDAKPQPSNDPTVTPIPPGATFLETDTGRIYRWDGVGSWTWAPSVDAAVTADTIGELVFETRVLHESLRVWLNADSPSLALTADGSPLALDAARRLPVTVAPAPVVITVTPTIAVTADIVTGDTLVASLTRLPNVSTGPGKTTLLQQLVVVDGSLQSITLELWFFDTPYIVIPALSAAWTVTDAEAAHCVGVVQTGTYYASALNSVSVNRQVGLTMRTAGYDLPNSGVETVTAPQLPSSDLWFAVIARGTADYVLATDLRFTFTFYPDA